jgi:hypothetical protein
MITCNLTDIAGNGYVNNGDAFVLSIVGSEVALQGVPIKLLVFYGGTPMGTMQFQIGYSVSRSPVRILLILGIVVVAMVLAVEWQYLRKRMSKAKLQDERH